MTEQQRKWTSGLIGFIAVLLIIWLSPSPVYKARGILLSTQTIRSPIAPSSVTQLSNRPFGASILGYINIERHYPAPNNLAHQEIVQLAKQLSSQVGANAFVETFFRVGQVTRSKYIYVFHATAYYVPTVQSSMELTF